MRLRLAVLLSILCAGAQPLAAPAPERAVAAWLGAIEAADVEAVIAAVDLERLAAPLARRLYGGAGSAFASAVSRNMRAHLRSAVAEMIRDDWLANPRRPGAVRDCRIDAGRAVDGGEYLYRVACLREGRRTTERLRVRRTGAGWKVYPLARES